MERPNIFDIPVFLLVLFPCFKYEFNNTSRRQNHEVIMARKPSWSEDHHTQKNGKVRKSL